MSRVYVSKHLDLEVLYRAELPCWPEEVQKRMNKDEYIARFSKLPSIGFEVDGRCVGGVVMEGEFIHISLLPEYHSRFAFAYHEALEWVFTQADPVYAHVWAGNKKCLSFCEHSGWERVDTIFNEIHLYRSTPDLVQRLRNRSRHRKTRLAAESVDG